MRWRVSWLHQSGDCWLDVEYHSLSDAIHAVRSLASMGRTKIALVGVPA